MTDNTNERTNERASERTTGVESRRRRRRRVPRSRELLLELVDLVRELLDSSGIGGRRATSRSIGTRSCIACLELLDAPLQLPHLRLGGVGSLYGSAQLSLQRSDLGILLVLELGHLGLTQECTT